MTVRHEVSLSVLIPEDGQPTATEASLIKHIAWVNTQGPYSSAYHEVMAHVAMMALRWHWEQATLFRQLEDKSAARKSRGTEKRRRGIGGEENRDG